MRRTTKKRLHDALSAGREVEGYIAGVSLDQFMADRSLQLIIERLFEIMGEATSKAEDDLPDLRTRIPEAGEVIGMRNRIAHGYWEVSYRILWDTALDDVPQLCAALERMLDDESID
ncbi:MAG: DUF86 domain-containing protein [Thermomicrobiales bacterium]|nr:DUF86 domain-containing protein [Thermomicrobiales bacterium]